MAIKFDVDDFYSRLYMVVEKYDEKFEDANSPFCRKGEFCLFPRVCLGEIGEDRIFKESAAVTYQTIVDMNLDVDSVINNAVNNTKNLFPGKLIKLSDYLGEQDVLLPDKFVLPQVYVITNNIENNGAISFFVQPELVDSLSVISEKNIIIFAIDSNAVFCIEECNIAQVDDIQKVVNKYVSALDDEGKVPFYDQVMKYDFVTKEVQITNGESFTLGLN